MKEKYDQLSEICSRATTRHYSTSFSLGIRLLEKRFREPIFAIYGFVRLADEIVDSFHGYNKKYLLQKFEDDCKDALKLQISLNPILNSFQHVVHRYQIDEELIRLFLNSMKMDLEKKQYELRNYEEYILGSAQVVGLMCLKVFTHDDPKQYENLKVPAMLLGSAFQKVNFLRDLNTDYLGLGRSYFPGVNIERFTQADKEKIEREIARDFEAALVGIACLPDGVQKGVGLAYLYYYRLFEKIKALPPENVLNGRIRISNSYKALLLIQMLMNKQFRNGKTK